MHLWAFAGLSFLLALLPGPDFALVTRNSLAHGKRGALLTVFGIAGGLTLWLVATGVGVVAIIETSATVFTILKLCGGVYLGYLGIVSLKESLHEPAPLTGSPDVSTGKSLWRQGFISASLNPKLGAFFVTFFPQFIDRNQPIAPQIVLLGAIFIGIGLGWMSVIGLSVSRLRDFITSNSVRSWLQRITGVALVGFGLLLLSATR